MALLEPDELDVRSSANERLRIAMLGPIAWRTPPRHYGPWEQVVSTLTEGLVAAGHDVTLYATGDSVTAARLRSVVEHGYEEDDGYDVAVFKALHIAACFEHAAAGEFDVVHNHLDFMPLTWSRLVDVPVVTTIHGFSSEAIVPAYRRYDGHVHYVAISDADRHPDLTYAATIHHGIDPSGFPFSSGAGRRRARAVLRPHPSGQGHPCRDRHRTRGGPVDQGRRHRPRRRLLQA